MYRREHRHQWNWSWFLWRPCPTAPVGLAVEHPVNDALRTDIQPPICQHRHDCHHNAIVSRFTLVFSRASLGNLWVTGGRVTVGMRQLCILFSAQLMD